MGAQQLTAAAASKHSTGHLCAANAGKATLAHLSGCKLLLASTARLRISVALNRSTIGASTSKNTQHLQQRVPQLGAEAVQLLYWSLQQACV